MTPQELTTLLYQSGALTTGSVVDIQIAEDAAFNSEVRFLHVRYSDDATPSLPTALVSKRNVDADWGREAGRREIMFYRLIGEHADRFPMIIPFYVAEYDPATGDSLLVMQDLSATHQPPVTREQQIHLQGVPAEATLRDIVITLATFHAAWWEHPQLALFRNGYCQDAEHFLRHSEEWAQNWQACVDAEGEWLPEDAMQDMTQINRLYPQLWERFLAGRYPAHRQLTLTHGDAYPCNFLAPRIEGAGPIYMMDWQSPYADFGARDIARLLVPFWTPEQRHENDRERSMMRLYLATLQRQGVVGYAWEQFLDDYRWALIEIAQQTIWDHANGSDRDYWWPKLQTILSAIREHDCLRLVR
jgi:thiamine kinase-like enzyme